MKTRIRWFVLAALAFGVAFPASVFADAPSAADKFPTTLEDTLVTVTLSGGDIDGDPLTFAIATGPSAGTLGAIGTPQCDGQTPSTCTADVDYTPNPNYAGADSFTYTTNDGILDSGIATVSITVTGVNDPPSFTDGSGKTVLEDSGAASYSGWATNISRGGGSDESSQVIHFVVSNVANTSLFSAGPAVSAAGTLTFTTAANANGSTTLDVTAVDDGGTANGGSDTSTIHTITISVTSVDDPPSFTKGGNQTVNEDSGAASVSTWATAVSPGPSDESAQTVSFNVAATNTALFSAQPAVAANGTLTYTPAANANGSTSVTISASDSGGATSGDQSFTITITAVNDVPSFTKGGNQTVNEDSGAASVPLWATSISRGPSDESSQTVTFTVVATDTSLFSAQPAVSSTGTLTYTPAANANGSTSVTISISDSGGTANGGVDTSGDQTFTISITAVNDAPSFTAGSNPSVSEDSGAASIPGWATGMSAGPPDETGQTWTFNVAATNTALFSAQPAVASNGDLSFTPAANAFGTTNVTVSLTDSGGMLNGGTNTSGNQVFSITINGVNDAPKPANDLPTVIESSPATAINVLANDNTHNPDGNEVLTITAVTQGGHGAVVITGGGTGLTYEPVAGYIGSDVFTYTVRDPGLLTGTASVLVTVVKDTVAPVTTPVLEALRTGVTMNTTIQVRVSWGATDPGVGVAKYSLQQSVDGGTYTTITLASNLTTAIYRSETVGHKYRYRVRATDSNGNVSAYRYGPNFLATRYQDNSTAVVYGGGTWGIASSTSYSGGTSHYSAGAGKSASLTTSGRDFAIVGVKGSTRGTFQVFVDGVLKATVSEAASTTAYRQVLWATHFGTLATHTIRIVVVGPSRIDLDCFLVLR